MYIIKVYLDDPELPAITLKTEHPKAEMTEIGKAGIFSDELNMYYPAHRIDRIEFVKTA